MKRQFDLIPFKRTKSASNTEWYFIYNRVTRAVNKRKLITEFKTVYPQIQVKNIHVIKSYKRVLIRFTCDTVNSLYTK